MKGIQAALKRQTIPEYGLTVYPCSCEIMTKDGKVIRLVPKIMLVLLKLMDRPGRIFTRDQLLEATDCQGYDRCIDQYILRLRKVLRPLGYDSMIQTRTGLGYYYRYNNQVTIRSR